MNFLSPDLTIKQLKDVESSNIILYFSFQGKFLEETSIKASKAWTMFMDEYASKGFEFIWDCKSMTGFEINARKEWYKAMTNYKGRIKKAYVVSDKLMIRSAAKVMLQFFGIKSEIVRSEDQLPFTYLSQ